MYSNVITVVQSLFTVEINFFSSLEYFLSSSLLLATVSFCVFELRKQFGRLEQQRGELFGSVSAFVMKISLTALFEE